MHESYAEKDDMYIYIFALASAQRYKPDLQRRTRASCQESVNIISIVKYLNSPSFDKFIL